MLDDIIFMKAARRLIFVVSRVVAIVWQQPALTHACISIDSSKFQNVYKRIVNRRLVSESMLALLNSKSRTGKWRRLTFRAQSISLDSMNIIPTKVKPSISRTELLRLLCCTVWFTSADVTLACTCIELRYKSSTRSPSMVAKPSSHGTELSAIVGTMSACQAEGLGRLPRR